MNPPPFFSILIPTYNRGYCIKNALDSILKQTFQDYEVIIVDDGSTDNTKDILIGYQDYRIKTVFLLDNRGSSYARNIGIDNAGGVYIVFLDSGEILYPNSLNIIAQTVKGTMARYNNYSFIITDIATGEHYNKCLLDRTGEIHFEDIIRGKMVGDYAHVTKKNVFEHIRFDIDVKGYERLLWHRIAKMYGTFYFTAEPVISANMLLPDSLTKLMNSANMISKWQNILLQSEKYLGYFEKDLKRLYMKGYLNEIKLQMKACMILGYKKKAKELIEIIMQESNAAPINFIWLCFLKLPTKIILLLYKIKQNFL